MDTAGCFKSIISSKVKYLNECLLNIYSQKLRYFFYTGNFLFVDIRKR